MWKLVLQIERKLMISAFILLYLAFLFHHQQKWNLRTWIFITNCKVFISSSYIKQKKWNFIFWVEFENSPPDEGRPKVSQSESRPERHARKGPLCRDSLEAGPFSRVLCLSNVQKPLYVYTNFLQDISHRFRRFLVGKYHIKVENILDDA